MKTVKKIVTLKILLLCGLTIFQFPAFAQYDPADTNLATSDFIQSIFDEFQIRLGESALNPERKAVPAININLSGSVLDIKKSKLSTRRILPFTIKSQYQLLGADKKVADHLLLEEFSIHLIQLVEQWNLRSNTDMEIDVKLLGVSSKGYSWASKQDPLLRQGETITEFVNVKPKLTIYLDKANREISFQVRGQAMIGIPDSGIKDQNQFIIKDPEVFANMQSRGGPDHSSVMFGSAGGAALKLAIGFHVELKKASLGYQLQYNSYRKDRVTVLDNGTNNSSAGTNPQWSKDIQSYDNYSAHLFYFDYRLNTKNVFTANLMMDSEGRFIYSGVGIKTNLYK